MVLGRQRVRRLQHSLKTDQKVVSVNMSRGKGRGRTCGCSHSLIGDIVVRWADASAGEDHARWSHDLSEAQQRGLDI